MSVFNNYFMLEALKEAELAFKEGEIPVGVVIVSNTNKEIITRAHNIVEQAKNPTLHAEIVAINQTCAILSSKNLSTCDLYVTLEPCVMCASAIANARIQRIFYAASDPKQGAIEHGVRFFTSNSCFHRPEVYSGFLAKSSELLLKNFFNKIRL